MLELAVRSLGWAGDERDRAYFAWKHDENPFGTSPAWVATVGDRIAGFRTLMRWELHVGDESLRCVRAVDTATDPELQGLGIFRRLTLGAVDALTADGFDAVFNTPNDKSRPGYLKMGWSELGRPVPKVRPRLLALPRIARSRQGAEKWSDPVTYGDPAAEVLASGALDGCGGRVAPPPGLHTRRTDAYLRWRYSFAPLHYRAVEVRGGWCIFRVRGRGACREVAICEWLSPERDARAVRRLLRACGGDYALAVGPSARLVGGVPLRSAGPIVTWRPLARAAVPDLADLALDLGDLELF